MCRYAWPSPPPSKKYVPDHHRSRIIPENPSGKPGPKQAPPPERGFWAPVPGGAWKKGARGLRFVPARKEPSGWHDPKKKLAFPPPTPADKENPDPNRGAAAPTAAAAKPRKPLGFGVPAPNYAQNGGRQPIVKPLGQHNGNAKAAPQAAKAGAAQAAKPKPAQYGAGNCNYTVYDGRSYNYNGQWRGFNGIQHVAPAPAPAMARRAGAGAPAGAPPQPQVQARPSHNQQPKQAQGRGWAPAARIPPAQPIPQPAAAREDDGSMCVIS